jgi:hypothetical protein
LSIWQELQDNGWDRPAWINLGAWENNSSDSENLAQYDETSSREFSCRGIMLLIQAPSKEIIAVTAGLLMSGAILAPSALAGRYVLNQTPQTIQRYFGRPWTIKTSSTNPQEKQITYSPAGIRRLFPTFPRQGQFGMTFVNNRVTDIWLKPNTPEDGDFSFDPRRFFNYIFGYQPPTWKLLKYPGGHEGFADYEACLGDGVLIHYMEYRLGANNISMVYNPTCEPPYSASIAPF